MKTWTFAINGKLKLGSLILIEQPWYVSFIEWINDNILGYWCDWFQYIPLPKFIHVVDKEDNQKYSLYDYYGSVGTCWHIIVCDPIFQWVYKHPKRKETTVELGYNKIKKMFYHDHKKFFDDHEKGY